MTILPHAGGFGYQFAPLAAALPAVWEVDTLDIPRPADGKKLRMSSLSLALAEKINWGHSVDILFGHSLGALLAFEISFLLKFQPKLLVLSGSMSPASVTQADFCVLSERIQSRAVMPTALDPYPEMKNFLALRLKQDIQLLREYSPNPTPYTGRVLLLQGTNDSQVPFNEHQKWLSNISGQVSVHSITGGHLFPLSAREETADAIVGALY